MTELGSYSEDKGPWATPLGQQPPTEAPEVNLLPEGDDDDTNGYAQDMPWAGPGKQDPYSWESFMAPGDDLDEGEGVVKHAPDTLPPAREREQLEIYRQAPRTIGNTAVNGTTRQTDLARMEQRQQPTRVAELNYTTDKPPITDRPPALEGEVYQGKDKTPPKAEKEGPEYFDDPMAFEPKVNILGDDKRCVDTSLYHVVAANARRMRAEDGGGVVVTANFTPGGTRYLGNPVEKNLYQPVNIGVTQPGGLLSALNNEQLAETIASAAGGDDDRVVGAYEDILAAVADKLEEHLSDRPSLPQIRDGVRVLTGMSVGPETTPTLDRKAREAVEDALDEATRKGVEQFLEPLKQFLDKNVREPSNAQPAELTSGGLPAMQDAAANPGKVTVVNVSVEGYGRHLRADSAMLSNALLPFVVERTPWGQPKVVVVTDAEHADPRALDELIRHCKAQEIRLVLTVDKVTERTASLVAGGAKCLHPIDAPQRKIASDILGTLPPGDALTGVSRGVTANVGSAEHTSENVGYKSGSHGIPETAGTSSSGDGSRGASWSETENVDPNAELPVATPGQLGTLRYREMAVFDSHGRPYGRYEVRTGRRLGEFPAPRQQPTLNVRGNIKRVVNDQITAETMQREQQNALLAQRRGAQGSLQPRIDSRKSKGGSFRAHSLCYPMPPKNFRGNKRSQAARYNRN